MTLALQRVAIVGASGPTGKHLARALRQRGVAVRAISRSSENLARWFPEADVERAPADARDRQGLQEAVAGCDLLVDSIGLPADRMQEHPETARVIADVVGATGVRCLQVSSFWSFLPLRRLPLDEDHPREGGNRYARARRAAEDALLGAGAAVVHLPDFFGPGVHTSVLQGPLQEAAAGRPMSWLGSPRTEREYVYVPDAMAMVADLAACEEAYGRSWVVPGSGPLTCAEAAALAGEHLGRRVKVRAIPGWLARTVGLVMPALRPLRPILEDYLQPIRFDGGRLGDLLGAVHLTPYPEAIAATLDAVSRAAESD
jgi:nucleoside-diphosphate-sugar epimerase